MANELTPEHRAEKIVRQGGIYPAEKAIVKGNIIHEIYAAELAARLAEHDYSCRRCYYDGEKTCKRRVELIRQIKTVSR